MCGEILFDLAFQLQEMKKLSQGADPCLFNMDGWGVIIGNECGKMGTGDRLNVFKSFGFKELIEFIES